MIIAATERISLPQKAQSSSGFYALEYKEDYSYYAEKLEELRTISEMLNDPLLNRNKQATYEQNLINHAINAHITKAKNSLWDLLRKNATTKLQVYFQAGMNEQIPLLWIAFENMLSVAPYESRLHEILLAAHRECTGELSQKALRIHETYRLQYLNSFGENVSSYPIGILCHGEELFVSDHYGGKIHHFDLSGRYKGPLPWRIDKPLSMFHDKDGKTIWACAFGSNQLLGFNAAGKRTETINLAPLLTGKLKELRPSTGCIIEQRVYLITVDTNYHNRTLISFSLRDLKQGVEVLPSTPGNGACDLTFYDKLYLADTYQSAIYTFNTESKRFNRFDQDLLPGGFIGQFKQSEDGFFLTIGQHLVKTSLSGKQIFCASGSSFLGRETSILGLTIHQKVDSSTLFLTEKETSIRPSQIHAFRI